VADPFLRGSVRLFEERVRSLLALHTEMGSVFCARRNINLFLLLTDLEFVASVLTRNTLPLGVATPLTCLMTTTIALASCTGRTLPAHLTLWLRTERCGHPYYIPFWRAVVAGIVDWVGWAMRLYESGYKGWMILALGDR
jgi:hypothetical protein